MKKLFVLVLMCNVWLLATAQNKLKFNESKPTLYLCVSSISDQVKSFQRANNIGTAKLISGSYIGKNNKINLDEAVFGNALRSAFPDSLMQGVGVLDWEGAEMAALKGNANNPAFIDALNKLMHVLDVAQRIRPNVSWGYYGLPLREFWNRNSDWKNNSDKILPLLKKQDILFPSLYMPYDTRTLKGAAVTVGNDYTKDNIDQSLALAAKLNKPVMPFVWHRFTSLKQVPVDMFKDQANTILSENVGGRKVAGIIWWNEDNYYFRQKFKEFTTEVNPSQDYHAYYDTLILNRSKQLLQVFSHH